MQMSGEIKCKFLTVLFSPKDNRLLQAIADDGVDLLNEGSHATGARAIYEFVNEKITLSGAPQWNVQDRKGSSDYVVFYPRSEELLALGNVHLIIPRSSVGELQTFGPQTNQAARAKDRPQTNAPPLEVFSDILSRQGGLSIFRDHVRVLDDRSQITCAMLTVISGSSNQVERIVADRDVLIRQEDMIATGDRAVYSMTNGIVELIGHPRVTTPERTVTADTLFLNRQNGTFHLRGKYRIEMKAKKGPTASIPKEQAALTSRQN
jgi:lipopolysaccharide export system protein LptA